jgi:hypothetical protein
LGKGFNGSAFYVPGSAGSLKVMFLKATYYLFYTLMVIIIIIIITKGFANFASTARTARLCLPISQIHHTARQHANGSWRMS